MSRSLGLAVSAGGTSALNFLHHPTHHRVDWDVSVDSTIVRVHQHAAGARTDPPPALAHGQQERPVAGGAVIPLTAPGWGQATQAKPGGFQRRPVQDERSTSASTRPCPGPERGR